MCFCFSFWSLPLTPPCVYFTACQLVANSVKTEKLSYVHAVNHCNVHTGAATYAFIHAIEAGGPYQSYGQVCPWGEVHNNLTHLKWGEMHNNLTHLTNWFYVL